MRFSDYFKIKRSRRDLWFDPVLSIDTPLFVDPFLLYAQEWGPFKGSHAEIIGFFNYVFKLIAAAQGKPSSLRYQKAIQALIFPEVQELCLGYTESGTRGSGSGRDLAKVIAGAIWEAIQAGTDEITHFEEISILRERIGADRISDITSGLLRRRLATYTAKVCSQHRIPVDTANYSRGFYDTNQEMWIPISAGLPRNPYSRRPVLLAPQRYLRHLPTINAHDFWDYCYFNENETIRKEFSYDVTSRVSKSEIIELARRHPELRRAYVENVEGRSPGPYDIELDEKGYVRWYDATAIYCQNRPLAFQITSETDFFKVVDQMVDEYRHFVENNAGWRLLWNDNGTRKGERAAQLLFLGIVKHYCQANNIDISREVNIGKGPVDFKVAIGYSFRALLELKLARNTKFWNGLSKQLPAYQRAERVKCGYFIVIVFSESDIQRVKEIQQVIGKVNQATGYAVKGIVIDARPEQPSASKL